MKDLENTKKESPMLGLTGLGGGVNSLMWAGAATQKFDMYAWGLETSQWPSTHPSQYYGYLAQNQSFGYKNSPVQVPGDWYKMWTGGITGNYGNTVGGSKDEPGTLWMWAGNEAGNLGQNDGSSNSKRSSPTQVGTETNWENVSISRYTLGVKDDGSLWAWGINQYGELGHNNKTTYSSPKQVGSDTTWSKDALTLVSSAPNAGQHSFAIKTDGTLWAWGSGTGGNFGQNSSADTDYSSPKQIGTNTTWKTMGMGSADMAVAIKTDGTLWAWGWGTSGGLGQNNRTQYSSPVQIGTNTNWKQACTGGRSWGTYGIKTDGTLWSWGYNHEGVLGLGKEPGAPGNWNARSSPTQVGARTDWVYIDAGAGNGSMIKGITSDGKIFLWGNSYADFSLGLGPGINASRISSPTQVANISTKWGTGSAYDHEYAWSVAGTKGANFCLRQQ